MGNEMLSSLKFTARLTLTIIQVIILISSFTSKCLAHFDGHTNNWAVLVDSSRFWFNYRHASNVLSMYHSVKRLGIPDSRIILMIADNMACNARNIFPGKMFSDAHNPVNLYGTEIEVDYRGRDVSVMNLLRLLTNRLPDSTASSKRLLTDEHSHVLIYMTGHGGEDFLKFHDENEISSVEIADAFEQMWQKRRYKEILFIADTCQAASLYSRLYSPNILAVASSRVGENSFSHMMDDRIGVFVADRYSYYAMQFLNDIRPDSKITLNHFLNVCPFTQCKSHVSVRQDLYRRDPSKVLVTEFFGSVRQVELLPEISVNITMNEDFGKVEEKKDYFQPNSENYQYFWPKEIV